MLMTNELLKPCCSKSKRVTTLARDRLYQIPSPTFAVANWLASSELTSNYSSTQHFTLKIDVFEMLVKTFLVLYYYLSLSTAESSKRFNLTILGLIVKTGNGPKNGKACLTAQQIVLDDVNARSDILADYNLLGTFEDEGPSSVFAVRAGVEFSRRSENEYISPITHGLTFTPGCTSFGSYLLTNINMVAISHACLSPVFTRNRKQFPNLYRTRFSGELGNFVTAAYLKMNGWRKIALYANADNSYNTMVAKHFYNVAAETDIDLIYFELGSGISLQAVQEMKSRGSRIIIIASPELPVILSFLCFSHQAGLLGPRYVFILSIGNIEPFGLAATVATAFRNCTREMVIEQFQRVVIVGAASSSFENYGNTTLLGYDIDSFDAKFARVSGGANFSDMADRLPCYDRMLTLVLALDRTEKKLSALNLTLRDFRRYPEIVMRAANQSVLESDVTVLRSGKIKFDKYGEFTEANFVATWRPSTGYTAHYKIVLQTGADSSKISAYLIQPLPAKLEWGTEDGKPPRDFASFAQVASNITVAGTSVLITIAALSMVAEVTVTILYIRRPSDNSISIGSKAVKTAFAVGCVFLDASAITFSLPANEDSNCYARILLTTAGVSLISGILLFRLLLLNKAVKRQPRTASLNQIVKQECTNSTLHHSMYNGLIIRPAGIQAPINTPAAPEIVLSSGMELQALVMAALFFICNAAVIAGLFSADPPRSQEIVKPAIYDNLTDRWNEKIAKSCQSSMEASYLGALTIVNFAFQTASSLLAYSMRAANISSVDKLVGVAAVNTTTLFAASVCILFITESSSVSQQIVIATASLVLSLSNACLVLTPVVWRLYR